MMKKLKKTYHRHQIIDFQTHTRNLLKLYYANMSTAIFQGGGQDRKSRGNSTVALYNT